MNNITHKDIIVAIKAALKAGAKPAPQEVQDKLALEIETAKTAVAVAKTAYDATRDEYDTAHGYQAVSGPGVTRAQAKAVYARRCTARVSYEKTRGNLRTAENHLAAMVKRSEAYRENIIMVKVGSWSYTGTPEQAEKMLKSTGVSNVARKHNSPSLSAGLPDLAAKVPVTGATPELLSKFLDADRPHYAKAYYGTASDYTVASDGKMAAMAPGNIGETTTAKAALDLDIARWTITAGNRKELGTVSARALATAARTMCAAQGYTIKEKFTPAAEFYLMDEGDVSACSVTETKLVSHRDAPVSRVVYGFPMEGIQLPGKHSPERVFTVARAMMQVGETDIVISVLDPLAPIPVIQFMGEGRKLFAILAYHNETATAETK